MAEAQVGLDRFLETTGDGRRRDKTTVGGLAADEPLLPLPLHPYPATVEAEATVGPSALVAFQSNHYSLPPSFIGSDVVLRHRLGSGMVEVVSPTGRVIAGQAAHPRGAGDRVRSDEHRRALEEVVLSAFTTAPRCKRKANRPPGEEAMAEAARLRALGERDVVIDFTRYADFAEGAG